MTNVAHSPYGQSLVAADMTAPARGAGIGGALLVWPRRLFEHCGSQVFEHGGGVVDCSKEVGNAEEVCVDGSSTKR